MNEEKVNKLKEAYLRSALQDEASIDKYINEIKKRPELKEHYESRIIKLRKNIEKKRDKVSYLRPDNEEDLALRADIKSTFAKQIDKVIPDGIPIVFHGRPNIGTVKKIIMEGGLKTPKDRGDDMRSFATAIDVGPKRNINAVLEFADSNYASGFPYGAIFAFYPAEDEVKRVLETYGTEVDGGVESVDFRTNPERLVGIISTPENIARIKEWCTSSGLDPNKVYTHQAFIMACELAFTHKSDKDVEAKEL